MTRDPIEYDGGDNTYAYVGANPVMFVDPSGLHEEISFGPNGEIIDNGYVPLDEPLLSPIDIVFLGPGVARVVMDGVRVVGVGIKGGAKVCEGITTNWFRFEIDGRWKHLPSFLVS